MTLTESNDPRMLATKLCHAHHHDNDWLDTFRDAFDLERSVAGLQRFQETWDLNQTEAGALFGVSRQAFNKWLSGGVPADHHALLGNLSTATDVLIRNLRRDRIPAVVRRPASALDNQTLLDLASKGKGEELLAACRQMFDYSRAQR